MKPIFRSIRGDFHLVLTIFLVVAISASLCGCEGYNQWKTYREAKEAYKLGDTEAAFKLLEQVPDAKDKDNIKQKVAYEYGKSLVERNRFEEGLPILERNPEYRDTKDLICKSKLEWADKLTKAGEYQQAFGLYKECGSAGKLSDAMKEKSRDLIRAGKCEAAFEAVKGIDDDKEAEDLRNTAQRCSFYLQGVEALDRNDFNTARKAFDKAVDIDSEFRILLEPEYLGKYCGALVPTISRLGEQRKNDEEILELVYPVLHKISTVPDPECEKVLRILDVVENRYFYAQTNRADWQQKIADYRKQFENIDARCNVYGSLMQNHMTRTRKLVNSLKALERIGGECNNAHADLWQEAKKTLELHLSTLALSWKKDNNFKKIMMLQKYQETKLKDLDFNMGVWSELTEKELLPEYKFGNTALGKHQYIINGWIQNPSKYRPLSVTGLRIDCSQSDSGKAEADCTKVKQKTVINPGSKKAITARVVIPSAYDQIANVSPVFTFEDQKIGDVNAEDLFKGDNDIVIEELGKKN